MNNFDTKTRIQTDEEQYKYIKKYYEKYPEMIISPNAWKKQRLIDLKKEGKLWSK